MKKRQNNGAPARALRITLVNFLPFVYAVTCIIPIVWLFITTFKSMAEFSVSTFALPKSFFNFDNYAYVLNQIHLPRAMFNTARITVIVLVLVLLLAFINGYFIARFRFKGRGLLKGLFACTLVIPIHAILVPTYILFSRIGLYNHWYSTILPMVCMELTVSIFLVTNYVQSIPREMEEAAAIDGSSFSSTLFRIILPVVKPVLVTCGIISFFHCWNEFPFSLILFSKEEYYTLSLSLMRFKGEYTTDYPRIMTTIFVSIIPALLVYIAFSKQIINGMMAGAVKG